MSQRKYKGKFMHFKEEVSSGGNGGATISYVVEEAKDGQRRVRAGVSFVHPNDNFSYEYGRNKADGRLTQLLLERTKPGNAGSYLDFLVPPEGDPVGFLIEYMEDDYAMIPRGKRSK